MHQRSVPLPLASEEADATELIPTPRKRLRRWPILCLVLRSSRAFSQVSKTIVDKTIISRSLSYKVIDIQPPQCFSSIHKSRLSKLAREQNTQHLHHFRGVPGLLSQLNTDVINGIDSRAEAISLRVRTFGSNAIEMPSPNLWRIVLKTFRDPILIVLFLSASLSLGFGIRGDGIRGATDALSIYVSLFFVIAATSFSNIWTTRQLHQLSRSNVIRTSTIVTRDGERRQISATEAVVGDIVHLQIGDQVPADGLYIEGDSFQVNEEETVSADTAPFLLAGSKVTKGDARMLITAVGMDTKWGEVMSSTIPTEEKTPLQVKVHKLTQTTAKIGLAVAFMVFMVLLIKYFTRNRAKDYTASKSIDHVWKAMIGILVMPIIIATAAIPEGLLLAATITLAYSTKRMAAEKAVVRSLAACEAIGSIKVICIDRSSVVSSEPPHVEQFWLGTVKFKRNPPRIATAVLQLMHEGIGLNTTSEASLSVLGELQAQKAIRSWASQELGMNEEKLKENCCVLDIESLNQHKKEGCIWILRDGDGVHIHMKGSTDEILALCSRYYEDDGGIKDISENMRVAFKNISQEMENNGLNCIAYAHAAFQEGLNQQIFILIGILGLKQLFRHNITKFVTECQEAGMHVIMITTEDAESAKISALQCGIIDPDQGEITDCIIKSREFWSLTDEVRAKRAETYSVMAGASDSDKLLLVQFLKQKGHEVGVIGGCSGDEKLFEEAGVAFYLDTHEHHSLKEKSDIIISGDSFDPIAKAMMWGRGIYNNIQIYVQFQLTATMASLVTDSVTAIFSGQPPTINAVASVSSGKIPFAALQILWVKLVVGLLVALALSVDNPPESLMRNMPVDRREPFITNVMWRDIIGQALCQIVILLIIQFEGETTFKLSAREKDTLIFNIFVLCQLFTIFNTVKGKNAFERLKRKWLFWMLLSSIILLQVVIVELLKRFAGTERLDWKHWRACIAIPVISWLVGWLLRKIHVPR